MTTAATRLLSDLHNYISEDVDMLVSRHVASYVPDLPAITIHQIKDEECREEDKLYFPICVFLLFLWLVLKDLHFVPTHVGHI